MGRLRPALLTVGDDRGGVMADTGVSRARNTSYSSDERRGTFVRGKPPRYYFLELLFLRWGQSASTCLSPGTARGRAKQVLILGII